MGSDHRESQMKLLTDYLQYCNWLKTLKHTCLDQLNQLNHHSLKAKGSQDKKYFKLKQDWWNYWILLANFPSRQYRPFCLEGKCAISYSECKTQIKNHTSVNASIPASLSFQLAWTSWFNTASEINSAALASTSSGCMKTFLSDN